MLADALDDTFLCAMDLRERFPDDDSRGAEKQHGDGDADDDVRPERLGPRDQSACDENRSVCDEVVARAQPGGSKVDVVRSVPPEKSEAERIGGKSECSDG